MITVTGAMVEAAKKAIAAIPASGGGAMTFYQATVSNKLSADLIETIARVGLTAALGSTTSADNVLVLPCDVHLPPNTYIQKGCGLGVLWTALEARQKWADENTRFPRKGG